MKLLVNTTSLLAPRTGIGQYTYQVAKRLAEHPEQASCTFYHGYRSATLPEQSRETRLASMRATMIPILLRAPLLKAAAKFAVGLSARAAMFLGERFDVYFEPSMIPSLHCRRNYGVVTVHDFSCLVHPEWHPKARVQAFEKSFWKGAAASDAIITVSESMRTEAIRSFGISESKVFAIPNGVDHAIFRKLPLEAIEAYKKLSGIPDKFILFVGTIEPRKNLISLLNAYEGLPVSLRRAYPLLLVGGAGWLNSDIYERMASLQEHVRSLGYVSDEELALLYNLATLFVYPSWYEGFGLPALEAMACGCPVLTSNQSALPEVCAEAARYVHPGDVDGMRLALEELLNDFDTRDLLARSGLRQAQRFSWDKSAQAHLSLFLDVCGQGPGKGSPSA